VIVTFKMLHKKLRNTEQLANKWRIGSLQLSLAPLTNYASRVRNLNVEYTHVSSSSYCARS